MPSSSTSKSQKKNKPTNINVSESFEKNDSVKKKFQFKKIHKIAIILFFAIVLFASIYLALLRLGFINALKIGLEVQQQQALIEADKAVLNSLKQIILLPDDIEPTMAIINDVGILKQEQEMFFANAKNGDRLIIYPNFAIIFDYNANQIINIGPIQFQVADSDPQATKDPKENTELNVNSNTQLNNIPKTTVITE